MQSLGERLQEARQRLGVTTREAADVTKIRSDFLQAMEANQFESIPLGDVYKRGFTKIYAKYLRLDEEKAVADFNTPPFGSCRPPSSRCGRRARRHRRGACCRCPPPGSRHADLGYRRSSCDWTLRLALGLKGALTPSAQRAG